MMKVGTYLPVKIFMFSLFILAFACSKNNVDTGDASDDQFDNVDPALWKFFSTFEKEAHLRGLSYDLNEEQVIGLIVNLNADHVAGQCNYNSEQPNQVIIDRTFWDNSSELWKELVVFHELGHCVLGRSHLETAFLDGICKSIMRSGSGPCIDNYNGLTREYYVDELFENQ